MLITSPGDLLNAGLRAIPGPWTTLRFWGDTPGDRGTEGSKTPPTPKGPKIEKIQDRPPGLKFSSEIENFKRATHQTPIFCWEF